MGQLERDAVSLEEARRFLSALREANAKLRPFVEALGVSARQAITAMERLSRAMDAAARRADA